MKKFNSIITCIFVLSGCNFIQAQNPSPAGKQQKSILLSNATVHDGDGHVFEHASVGFAAGKITWLSYEKSEAKIPAWDTTIDVGGRNIYPGLIALNTTLGLSEIEAVRATNDFNETGKINPSSRALIAYNTDSRVIPTVRSNGVLLAQITPQGGLFSGTSSIVQMDAWNWEDALIKADEGVHMNWPSMRMQAHFNAATREEAQKNEQERIKNDIQKLEQWMLEAHSYCLQKNNQVVNRHFEAMRNIFEGKAKLYVHADAAREIAAASNLMQKYSLKWVLVGGAEALQVSQLLKKYQVPVIIGRTHALPQRDDDVVNAAYTLPYLLQQEGIEFALSCEGFWQVRNLPFMAGTAAAYGLSKEEALRAITLSAAKIAGIDAQTGSLSLGKDATLLVVEGDLLDMSSSIIAQAFIQGRQVSLDNVQKQLYQKYCEKYGIK